MLEKALLLVPALMLIHVVEAHAEECVCSPIVYPKGTKADYGVTGFDEGFNRVANGDGGFATSFSSSGISAQSCMEWCHDEVWAYARDVTCQLPGVTQVRTAYRAWVYVPWSAVDTYGVVRYELYGEQFSQCIDLGG